MAAKHFLGLVLLCSIGMLGQAAAGCSAGTTDDGGGSSSTGTKAGQTGSFATGTSTFSSGTAGDCSGNYSCSADLHNVLCDGNVVQTCPADQGCAEGGCVAACDSAKANKSSVGCDYYDANPDGFWDIGACFATFVANTWTTPAKLSVEWQGAQVDVSNFARIPVGSGTALTYQPLTNGELQPGQIAILFLAQFNPGAQFTPACPAGVVTANGGADAALHGTGIGNAFHITSDVPVVAYDIFPYGGGPSAITSATLLLPTTAWDTNYLAVLPWAAGQGPTSQPYVQVIASQDNTQVTISPTTGIVGGPGVAATGPGVPATYNLNRGQVLQFTQDPDLSGSPIQSTQPVVVITGNDCMNVPDSSTSACDAGHQMIPPVKALGHEYVGVHHRNRFPGVEEHPPWRIMGAVAGTTLTYEPAPPAGAPATIGVGQVVSFETSAPFVVKSQDADHPFYMSGHMTGCTQVSTDTFGDCRGDPETVNTIPPEEFLDDYVFFTDPTYPETSLVVVRQVATDGTFKDVTLDCLAGPIAGWQNVGDGSKYQFTYVDLVTGNFAPQNGCDNGRHEAKSEVPFGVTVWGWGSGATGGDPSLLQFPYSQYVSYAYPAGASVQPITTVIVPPVPQ